MAKYTSKTHSKSQCNLINKITITLRSLKNAKTKKIVLDI